MGHLFKRPEHHWHRPFPQPSINFGHPRPAGPSLPYVLPGRLGRYLKVESPFWKVYTIGFVTAIRVIFETGGSLLILGWVADHLNFRVGILGSGALTAFSSLLVRFLGDRGEGPGDV